VRTRILVLAAAISLAWASQAVADINVGFQTSLSGPTSSIGVPQAKGVATAHAVMGEVDGHKIKLIQLDDASDPSTSARNARKLIEESKVDFLIGAASSPLTIAMASISNELKVPMIALAPISLPPDRASWLVVVPQPPPLMVAADVEHMKKAGVKTIGYIGFNDAWGDLVYDALVKAAAEAGLQVVNNERYARADTSVTAQVLKTIALRPDAVVTGGSGSPGALPHLALAERGYRGAVYSTHAIINPDFIRVGGAAAEGVIAPTGPVIVAEQLPSSNPVAAVAMRYRAEFQKVQGAPTSDAFSAYGYDGWLIFLDAAKRALRQAQPGTAEFRTALRDALVNTKDVVGTHGIYNFKPGQLYGVDARARVVVKLEKGQWKLLQ
jgi:branched-chain amino acid transport system substrate-binding protein